MYFQWCPLNVQVPVIYSINSFSFIVDVMASIAKLISEAEKEYIVGGCSDGIRSDGRGVNDFRVWSFENNVFPHVNGSSRVKIGDAIDIMCSIKLEVGEPRVKCPLEGSLDVNVDISPSCGLRLDEHRIGDFADQVADLIER